MSHVHKSRGTDLSIQLLAFGYGILSQSHRSATFSMPFVWTSALACVAVDGLLCSERMCLT
ncbi:hypothetical protein HGG70_02495 [Rhodobacteraceae bacterium R_SAG4]|nr:hypothetical protein [Rhodobacteraceae bacterium R_SAG4]